MKTLRIHSPILVKPSGIVNIFSDASNRIVKFYNLIRIKFVKLINFFLGITKFFFKKFLRFNVSWLHNLMAKFTNNWSFQHLLNRPTELYTTFKNATLKIFFSRPLSHWLRSTLIGNKMIIRSVKVLIPQGIPSAVRLAIISVRIFAVNSGVFLSEHLNVFKVRFMHILLKIFKRNPQAFNATPTITLKSVMLEVVAPLLNGRPNLIEPSPRHSVFHALSLAGNGFTVNQFYIPRWTTKSQLIKVWNKAHKK